MKRFFFLIFAIITSGIFAQTTTTGELSLEEEVEKDKVVIVPFEPRMYISDINRSLATENNMSSKQIAAKFRAALDQNIFLALKTYHNPFSFYTIDEKEAIKELSYIYNSIGYKYEVMPQEEIVEKETLGKKFLNKIKKKEEEEPQPIEAKIHNGEIVSQVDNREKYMKTNLSNNNLLATLNKKYQAKHYLFINQLDIKRGADVNYQATENAYKREIKVHYTIFDANAEVVSSGAVKSLFATSQNNMDKIIKTQIPLIAQNIAQKLYVPEVTPTEE